jgi:hypothetical protein
VNRLELGASFLRKPGLPGGQRLHAAGAATALEACALATRRAVRVAAPDIELGVAQQGLGVLECALVVDIGAGDQFVEPGGARRARRQQRGQQHHHHHDQ